MPGRGDSQERLISQSQMSLTHWNRNQNVFDTLVYPRAGGMAFLACLWVDSVFTWFLPRLVV